MPEIVEAVEVPGPEEAVLALWDDPARWPSFVDGFRRIVRIDDGWPAPGAAVVWDTGEHGAGRTREVARQAGVRTIETEQLTGTLSVAYVDGYAHVSLEYELKQRSPYTLFFVRRALRDAQRRTVARFAIERRADANEGSGPHIPH